MVFTVIMLIPRKPGLTPAEFKDYYENHHVPLCLSVLDDTTKPTRHSRYYIKRDASAQGDAPVAPPIMYIGTPSMVEFDCVTMVEFEDEAHFDRYHEVFKTGARRHELKKDQEMFEDETRFIALAVNPPEVYVRS